MKVLILGFSNNIVSEDSFIPNEKGLTQACVDVCDEALNNKGIDVEFINMNKKNINKCFACGKRGWGICYEQHKCVQKDDFNDIYEHMNDFDKFIFVTPVYFHEMSESAKAFFDRLKRCDAFNDESKIKGKDIICIACAGGSGRGTENTLNSFDILNHFLNTTMIGRIPVTKFDFDDRKDEIINIINKING